MHSITASSHSHVAINRLPSGIKRFTSLRASRASGRVISSVAEAGSHVTLAEGIAHKMKAHRTLSQAPVNEQSDNQTPVSSFFAALPGEMGSAMSTMEDMDVDPNDRLAAEMLSPLLCYVPGFVRERCVSGEHLDMLAEHRHVSVLFFIGQPKARLAQPHQQINV
eukprot:scaffold463553_cov45-Prasinocladus_malaysianus.AAC.1